MSSKGTTTYVVNGVQKKFYFPMFKLRFEAKSKEAGGNRNVSETEERLAEYVGVSQAAVHSWRNQKSAPGDPQIVKGIEEFLELEPGDLLFTALEDGMNKLDGQQREAVSRVYRDLEDYLYLVDSSVLEFEGSFHVGEGSVYANYFPVYLDFGEAVGKGTTIDDGTALKAAGINWVKHSLRREWVMLGSHPVYVELEQFLERVLMDVMMDEGEVIAHDLKISSVDVERLIKTAQEIISQYL